MAIGDITKVGGKFFREIKPERVTYLAEKNKARSDEITAQVEKLEAEKADVDAKQSELDNLAAQVD